MISVAVADDHPVVRAGLVQMLTASGEVEVVAEADDGVGILDVIRRRRPRVVLSDFRMPGLDGAALCTVVREERLASRIIVLSAYTDRAIVSRCMECGAAGFVGKDASRSAILAAIRLVDAGGRALPEHLSGGELTVPVTGREPVSLSPREREILSAVAEGASAPAIAARMHLSLSTVKTYLQRIYDKLGVNERGAAVAEALRRGILQ